MGELISVVEDVFDLAWGITIAPGIPHASDKQLRVGDALILKRPDGSVIRTQLKVIPLGNRRPEVGQALTLGDNISKEDIPLGTELWTE